VFCPKVFVGAVAAGGDEVAERLEIVGEAVENPPLVPMGTTDVGAEVAVLAGEVGAALDPDDVPGVGVEAAPAPPDAPGTEGVVPPVPPPGSEDGGRALWWRAGWLPPGIRISEAATTAAAASAAAPRTGRRR
jgi:hypothetical protein